MTSRVDLHIHTTFSDGLHTPTEIVEMSRAEGLSVISISDHACVDGVPEAIQAAAGTQVQVVPGVEISTEVDGLEVHILGYFVNHASPKLRTALSRIQDLRLERAKEMLTRLRALGLAIPLEQVQELAGHGALGRPHLAMAMVEAHFVSSAQEAFQRYLGSDRPAYVPRSKTTPADAFRLIRAAGGVPVLAHPWRMTQMLPGLVAKGLMGLETYYTGYSPEMTNYLVELAHRYHLVCTGGSDFHGLTLLPNNRLGQVHVPLECVELLRDRHRLLVEAP